MDATKRGRLLIVDDAIELKSALCETLADEGYETVGASSGAEGLRFEERVFVRTLERSGEPFSVARMLPPCTPDQ